MLKKRVTGLTKDPVVNVSQIVSLDKSILTEKTGRVPDSSLKQILHGLDIVFNKQLRSTFKGSVDQSLVIINKHIGERRLSEGH